ncbi:hypothetical protein QC764_300370 [Podospora pseudoanserina]|uniref:C2H2-type domain-containing protein n=1 Tax=Podospora pseudoanserina TaxID=2609844 RepID=A0ABR0IBT7_9PEZI|nr:hypothetical protein QC764_300370 [Podospora pseudoanserina]
MVDVTGEDDSYWWARSPGDLQMFDVPDVPVPTLNIHPILYEYEYNKWMERVGAIPEAVVDLDPNYKPLPPRDLAPELMTVLRFGRTPTWPELWRDAISSPYFAWPNYKPCLSGPITCFTCLKPLDIPYAQEPEGAFGNYDGEAPFEDAVIVEGCSHIMGADCLQAWLESKYPNDGQKDFYRWVRGEIMLGEWDEDFQQRIKPYHENPALRRTIEPGCPICAAPQTIDTNYGTETMDRSAVTFKFPNIKRINVQCIRSYAEMTENDMLVAGFPWIVLRSKKSYREEVERQRVYFRTILEQYEQLGCETHPDVPGGPYNALDYAYLRNKAYERVLMLHVGELLYQDHLWRLQNPHVDVDSGSDEDMMDVDDDDNNPPPPGGGGHGAGNRQQPRTPPNRQPRPPVVHRPPRPANPPNPGLARPPIVPRWLKQSKRNPNPYPRPLDPNEPAPPPVLPAPDPWPLDYDTPEELNPLRCPWCGRDDFKKATQRRKHEYRFHNRPDLGMAGRLARDDRRAARKDAADMLRAARRLQELQAADPPQGDEQQLRQAQQAWLDARRPLRPGTQPDSPQPPGEARTGSPAAERAGRLRAFWSERAQQDEQQREEYRAKIQREATRRELEPHEELWLQGGRAEEALVAARVGREQQQQRFGAGRAEATILAVRRQQQQQQPPQTPEPESPPDDIYGVSPRRS